MDVVDLEKDLGTVKLKSSEIVFAVWVVFAVQKSSMHQDKSLSHGEPPHEGLLQ